MRSNIADYNAVVEAASKFTRSVAEGNSKYAKELFTEDACLFGFLNGKFERGSIEQFYRNVDTVGAGENFKTRIDVLELEETLAVVRVLEEGWGWQDRLHGRPSSPEDRRRMEVRRQGVQPELEHN